MTNVQEQLNNILENFLSLKLNGDTGLYEMEIGIPSTWVFKENDNIGCEILVDCEQGKIIKLYPKKDSVIIDHLIKFDEILISNNKKIIEKVEELNKKKAEMIELMDKEFTVLYEEIDDLKELPIPNHLDNEKILENDQEKTEEN